MTVLKLFVNCSVVLVGGERGSPDHLDSSLGFICLSKLLANS